MLKEVARKTQTYQKLKKPRSSGLVLEAARYSFGDLWATTGQEVTKNVPFFVVHEKTNLIKRRPEVNFAVNTHP